MTVEPQDILSRDNPLVKELRALAQDNAAYRRRGRVWLDGDHLCRALLARGQRPAIAVFSASGWLRADAPFTPQNGFATANGRARRDALWQAYAARLDAVL